MINDFTKDLASQAADLAMNSKQHEIARYLIAAHDYLTFGNLPEAHDCLSRARNTASFDARVQIGNLANDLKAYMDLNRHSSTDCVKKGVILALAEIAPLPSSEH